MFSSADPYNNIQKKHPAASKRLAPILEARAAEPQQVAIRQAALKSGFDGVPGNNLTVLDIGCGTGALVRDVAAWPNVGKAIGVDPSKFFIEDAQRLARSAPCAHKMDFRHGLGGELPVSNGVVDVAVIWTVLVHVPTSDIVGILRAAKRALKPGGRLIIADNDLSGWSCANGKHDCLSVPLAWFAEAYIQDPWLCHKLPQLLTEAGFDPSPLQLHTVVDSSEDSYGYKHVMMSSIDAFAASGCAGPGLVDGLKSEVARRVKEKSFKVVLPYGVCVGTVPGGAEPNSRHIGQLNQVGGQVGIATSGGGHGTMCALGGGAAPFRQVAEIPLGGLLVAPTARRPSADGVLPLLPDPALPGGGRFDSPSFLSALAPMLRPLRGASQALLPGEQIAFSKPTRNAQRPPADVRRPNARVRLFAVSGIADFGARLQGLVDSAPQWLEVRLMDLPGHGQRANNITTDGLPPCAFRQSEDAQRPNAGGESAKAYVLQQLTDLVEQLVDEMWPLLLNGEASRLDTTAGGGGSSGFVPYALLGFSFGAMLAYRIERALRKRGAPAPLLLVAVGRPAPHCMILPSPLIDHLRRCDDQEVMNFVQDKLQLTVPSKAVGVTVFARSAALFRLGLLLNGAHAGLIDPQTSASATCIYDGLPPAHASEAPKTGCSVLALGGSFDVTARELLVKRWHEAVAAVKRAPNRSGIGAARKVVLAPRA